MADDNHLMSSLLRRKAEPEIISRKATSGSGAAKAGPSASSPAITASASRSSAVQQIHRSLKAWRDEDKGPAAQPAEADKASDEKVDDGAKDAKSAGGGGEQTNANKNLAQDDSGKQAGAEGAEGSAALAAGAAPEAAGSDGAAPVGDEVKEEAPSVGTKLKVLAKPKTAEEKKKKEEEIEKKKELLKKQVELAAAQADQTVQLADLAAGIGIDALSAAALLIPPPAGPAIAAAIKGLGGVASPAITIALDAQREVQASLLTKSITTMGAASVKKLANKWSNVEPQLKAMETDILFHVKLVKESGVGGTKTEKVGAGIKGVAEEAAKQGIEKGAELAESFLGKWVPFVGTAIKLAELAKVTHEIAALRAEIETMQAELL